MSAPRYPRSAGLDRGAALAGIVLAALAAVPARAAQPLQPVRDVVATYRLSGPATGLVPGGLPGRVRLSWDAPLQRVRLEAEGRDQVVLFDLGRRRFLLIEPTLRAVLPLPVRPDDIQPLVPQDARLSAPRGRARIAGLGCTLYDLEGAGGGRLCLSDDGVPLQGEATVRGRPGRFEAVAVQYGPLPRALFEPPAGYVMLGGQGGGAADGGTGGAPGGINPRWLRALGLPGLAGASGGEP